MSANGIVTVNSEGAVIALNRLRLNLQRRGEMYKAMGAAMLVSIRRTFREQGSPAGSWVPLAPSTVARDPKKYGAGHKLLIDSGVLLNSIQATTEPDGVVLSTNVKYAAVQNYGSRDRTGGAIGPQAKLADRAAKVPGHYRTIKLAPRYELRTVEGKDGKSYRVPRAVYKQKDIVRDKNGKLRTVTRNLPDGVSKNVRVRPHGLHQNIPARPFMVFRPEDPERLRQIAVQFNNKAIQDAGLAGGA